MKAKGKNLSTIETDVEVPFSPPRVGEGADGAAKRAGDRQIEIVRLTSLKKSRRNARTHSKKQIEQVAHSMRRFGVVNPLIVDSRNYIVAGHARADAARSIGLTTVPVIKVTDLTELELRAYMLADNRIALNAGWNRELLAVELDELQIALPDIGLDLNITGFEAGEVDSIITDFADGAPDPVDDIPEVAAKATAQRGDLFLLGNHRLLVGDARDSEDYSRLMGSQTAEMAFLDPPYNVPVQGHVGGRGRIKHREFMHGSGELTSRQFTEFLKDSLGACARFIGDGGIAYVCMDWRHSGELLEAGGPVFDELKNICVWTKSNAGQGSFYRSAHEFVFVYKRGKAPHINTFGLGQNGRSRTNVWNYAGVNSFRAGRLDDLNMHPTVKPVAMIADAMKDCSRRGSIILDKCLGRHEIAVMQTTAIGQAQIVLTTLLVHASGEWVSSTWPVCLVAEPSAQVKGAALTYARRYALFTLVGIAGEEDLDAPDLTTAGPSGNLKERSSETEPVPKGPYPPADTPTRHRPPQRPGRSAQPERTKPPTLPPDASEKLRQQLISELDLVSDPEALATWAHRVLPLKKQLSTADAQRVEAAFATKLDQLNAATSAQPTHSGDKAQKSRRRQDAQVRPITKPVRERDRNHLRFVASRPCLVCGRSPSDAHHLKFAEQRTMGRKVSDKFTVPICRLHHRELHRRGDERIWYGRRAHNFVRPRGDAVLSAPMGAFAAREDIHVQLRFDNPKSPHEAGLSSDHRELALFLKSVSMES